MLSHIDGALLVVAGLPLPLAMGVAPVTTFTLSMYHECCGDFNGDASLTRFRFRVLRFRV